MKKIQKIYEENKKVMVASALIGTAAMAGYYALKRYNRGDQSDRSSGNWVYDSSFH